MSILQQVFAACLVIGQFKTIAQENSLAFFPGTYSVTGGIRNAPSAEFMILEGEATFANIYNENQIVADIQFTKPMPFRGKTFINYSTGHQRYEMFQIDVGSSQRSTVFMLGNWEGDALVFSSDHLPEHHQWGMNPFRVIWKGFMPH